VLTQECGFGSRSNVLTGYAIASTQLLFGQAARSVRKAGTDRTFARSLRVNQR
jgi:hypothetical protein